MGRYDDAIAWYERGIEAVEHLPEGQASDRLELELDVGIAIIRFRQGELTEAVSRLEDAVGKALAIGEQLQLGIAYMLLHAVFTEMGAPERVAFRGLALPIFEQLGDLKRQATELNNMGIDLYWEGEWARALEVYERSRALSERIGDVTSVAMAMNNIGEILSDQGKLDEAEKLFRSVQEIVDAAGHRGLSLMSRLNLGRLAARAGRFDEADELLKEAADGFHEIHAASLEREVRARIAEAAVLAGRHDRAFREAELAAFSGEESVMSPTLRALLHRVRGYAYMQVQRHDDAALEFEHSVAAAREGDALFELALSLRAEEILRGDSFDEGEAQRIFDTLQVSKLPNVPTG
jgi:tetratricopeptide (TPR) repeat protein